MLSVEIIVKVADFSFVYANNYKVHLSSADIYKPLICWHA